MKTILVVASLASSLANFRGPLLAAFKAAGHRVHAAAPGLLEDEATVAQLERMGVIPHDIPLSRTGLNPIADAAAFLALRRLMKRLKPDVTLGYTIKPVIWGTLAAAAAGVPRRFALITGLGYAFTGEATGKRRVIQGLARALYRLALGRAHGIFFQNPDDCQLFRELKLVPSETPVTIVNGSGVDLDRYCPAPLPAGPIRFLLIARLLVDKGIREYVEAARLLRRDYPDVRFHLVGGTDSNPEAIPEAEIAGWQAENAILWHGAVSDVRPSIEDCHVYVLPSYREGTPRTVLEAMAIGRAIVTTDAPGCRETVVDGDNGYLVEVRSANTLAAAMRRFIQDPALAEAMGKRSQEIARDKYDVHAVNRVMLSAMGL